MAQHYAKDKNYIEKIDAFLCAGKSDTVEQIFASIGIETNKKSTFLNALKTQEKQIKQFEELVAKRVQ
jgi:oligoendopeptidase F